MNLQDFVGQTVSVRFRNGDSNSNCSVFRTRDGKLFFLNGDPGGPTGKLSQGPYSSDGKYCPVHEGHDIVSIEPVFTGLAQARPGIDLEDFVNKTVLIYLNKESFSEWDDEHVGEFLVGNVKRGVQGTEKGYFIKGFFFYRDGARVTLPGQYIERIYDQDSFMVCTKPLPDTNPELDELAQKLKTLSESDIAKLLHSIRK